MRRRQIYAERGAIVMEHQPEAQYMPPQSLKAAREARGLSLDEVAELAGVKPGYVAMLERTESARKRILEALS